MSQYPLSIVGLGMISCVGEGAEVNAAAMNCDYDGFQETIFNQPYYAERQLGAPIESELRGIEKLVYMSIVATKDAIKKLPENYLKLNVIYCMPDKKDVTFFNNEGAVRKIIENTFKKLQLGTSSSSTTVLWQQRCGFVSALIRAKELLYQKEHEYVLIISLDSLLNNASLSRYGGGLYGDNRRLLGENFSNGFIPGEAATAVLLSTPRIFTSDVIISGVGEGNENAILGNADEVLKGYGLTDAINHASKDAEVSIHDIAFRVSSVSGEDYFFTEAALAQIKTLNKKIPEQPLWHPADNVGEIGAAIGGAIVIMTYYAFTKKYAPGNKALCQISNDNSQRGAFIMQYKTATSGV